ncbi:MAG: GNAT family N-acetyltransferase [Alphaproteobacteria bacterium]|nr:GNAT family N-acetyltransferase [Alphaproteobacteria bacterium]
MDIEIKQAGEDDISALYKLYDLLGKKDAGYFESCFKKDSVILIASKAGHDVGFGVLNFEPKYGLYKKLAIPEIQDLNVIPEARQQGIATKIIEAFEHIAQDQGVEQIGISVGLTKPYGPAQRLYVKLGYMPDGYGITYDREAVTHGASCPVDDDLALMMVKKL